ncbi:hypothetical protein MKX03_010409 [Papaver bracteatum]|nr:hypothetical protein MKX03_010409 [Papaver bracteatum]
MAEIVIGPLVEIAAENGIQAFTCQVRYCINYKKSARNLARKVKDLNDMSTDIQNRVIAAKKNLDSIKRVVVTWLERVNKEADQDEMVLGLMRFVRGEDAEISDHDQCCKGWCCVLNRHKIGKESEKKIVVIDKLLNEGKELGEVSDPYSYAVTEIITKSIKSEDSVAFVSQEYVRKQVMSALKDQRTFSVGIYGMGGVGKTTLKNQIHKQVIEENLFNAVITIIVSQNVNLRNIQNDIAEALQFHKLKTVNNEITRAALLKERLEQEKKVLVIFDDLWERDLDLSDMGIPYCHKDCKVLITTRFLEVCNSLKIQQNVKLKVLSDEDSWYLFRKNAGDAVDSPTLQTVAREVVKDELTLGSLGSLREIFHGPMPTEFSLENLRRVKLTGCPDLVYVFSHEVLLKLKNLEILRIRSCLGMKEVFVSEEGTQISNEKEEHGMALLPQFRQLILVDLVITTIWKGIFSPIHCFGNMNKLEVHNCSRLSHLFTPAIVIALPQLERIYIWACGSLVTIIASEDQLTSVEDNQVINNHFQSFFSNLCTLYIEYCKRFKDFVMPLAAAEEQEGEEDDDDCIVDYNAQEDYYFEDYDDDDDGHCPSRNDTTHLNLGYLPHVKNILDGIQSLWNITSITVATCGRLKHLIPIQVLVSGGLSQLRSVFIYDCKHLEAIFYHDDVVVADQQNHIILENLEKLIVRECKSLKYILPKSLLAQGGLRNLEILEVKGCAEIEMILYEDGKNDIHGDTAVTSTVVEVLAKLRRLYLLHLPSLSSFHQQGNTSLILGWPSLVSMFAFNCNLMRLPFSHTNVPPKLEKIRGDSVELFEKWLEFEDEHTKSNLPSLFKIYGGDRMGVSEVFFHTVFDLLIGFVKNRND